MTATFDLPGGITLSNVFSSSAPYLTGVEGWTDSVDRDQDWIKRPGTDGDFDAGPPERRGRSVKLSGRIMCGSASEAWALEDKLKALENYTDPFEVGGTDTRGRRSISARLNGRGVAFEMKNEKIGLADFSVSLYARDPLKYGAAVRGTVGRKKPGGGISFPLTFPIMFSFGGDSGAAALVNEGTAPTYSSFEVTGGSDGFVISEQGTGRSIRLERTIPAASKVRVDQRTGRVTLDGDSNDISTALTRRDWFAVPPKSTTTIVFQALGTIVAEPILTHTTRPAHW